MNKDKPAREILHLAGSGPLPGKGTGEAEIRGGSTDAKAKKNRPSGKAHDSRAQPSDPPNDRKGRQ
jgi:hypothetical protein